MRKEKGIIVSIALGVKEPPEPKEFPPTVEERIQYALDLIEGRSKPNPKAVRFLQRVIQYPHLEKRCPKLFKEVKEALARL